MMNIRTEKTVWKRSKHHAQELWQNLTDEEINNLEGTRQSLSDLLQNRYGYGRERAEKEANMFFNRYMAH